MPDADISLQGIQGFFMKYFADKPHVFVPGDISFRAICVTDGNTAGFLSAVLQSRKPVVDGRRRIPLSVYPLVPDQKNSF